MYPWSYSSVVRAPDIDLGGLGFNFLCGHITFNTWTDTHNLPCFTFSVTASHVAVAMAHWLGAVIIWSIWWYCHDRDIRSTLHHSVWLCPHVYRPFHCMYLCFLIVPILFISPPIGEHFVQSVCPYDYLMCFHLWFQLFIVPVPIYLLIWYTSGNQPRTSPSLLIALHELCSSLACPTLWALPHTFYCSI